MPQVGHVYFHHTSLSVLVGCEGVIIELRMEGEVVSREKQERLGGVGHRPADSQELLQWNRRYNQEGTGGLGQFPSAQHKDP